MYQIARCAFCGLAFAFAILILCGRVHAGEAIPPIAPTVTTKSEEPKDPWSFGFNVAFARNREHIESIGQYAYISLGANVGYEFESGWGVGLNQGAFQQLKPHRVWRYSDTSLGLSAPALSLGAADFSLGFSGNFSFPTSKFSRDELQLTLGSGVSSQLSWTVSKAETWTLSALSYSLGFNRNFYKYKTDVAGEPVSEWVVSHSLAANFALFRKLTASASFYLDSEFRSSGKIFNSFSLDTSLSYRWLNWLSTYVSVSNSGDALRTRQRLANLSSFNQRQTQLTVGASFSF